MFACKVGDISFLAKTYCSFPFSLHQATEDSDLKYKLYFNQQSKENAKYVKTELK